jgi:hypothetical protein
VTTRIAKMRRGRGVNQGQTLSLFNESFDGDEERPRFCAWLPVIPEFDCAVNEVGSVSAGPAGVGVVPQ